MTLNILLGLGLLAGFIPLLPSGIPVSNISSVNIPETQFASVGPVESLSRAGP